MTLLLDECEGPNTEVVSSFYKTKVESSEMMLLVCVSGQEVCLVSVLLTHTKRPYPNPAGSMCATSPLSVSSVSPTFSSEVKVRPGIGRDGCSDFVGVVVPLSLWVRQRQSFLLFGRPRCFTETGSSSVFFDPSLRRYEDNTSYLPSPTHPGEADTSL